MKMKMKRLFVILLSFALVLGLIPGMSMTVRADSNAVAKVGNTEYDTFDAAKQAWVDGTTLTLLSDVKIDRYIDVSGGTKTLDLNGYGIMQTGNGYYSKVISVSSKADLTIIDSNSTSVHYIRLEDYRATEVSNEGTEESITNGTGTVKVSGGYIAGGISEGAGLYIDSSNVTLNAGTIIGNRIQSGGSGVRVFDNGSFIMNGGSIVYNYAENGGAVSVYGGSSGTARFNMNGGSIAYNAAKNGGAMRLERGSIFTMTGGSITDNSAKSTAGAIYWPNGDSNVSINLSGSAVIKNNKKGDSEQNIYLYSTQKITVDGALTDDACIGVTMDSPGVFTNSENKDYNDPTKFVSDDTYYGVGKNSDGHLFLGKKEGTPNATFTATDAAAGTIEHLSAQAAYIISGAGLSSQEITAGKDGAYNITSGMTAGTLSIVKKGDDTPTIDSDAQEITVTKATTPNLTVTQPTVVGGKGTVATTTDHEYSSDNGKSWKPCTANQEFEVGSYLIRVKASKATLASDNQTVEIKAATSRTVTFKVVNGSWNGGDAKDQTVTLTGKGGEAPKLSGDDIPAVGTKPADGYKEGAWDKVPVAGAEITEDTTYTYTYAAKDAITKKVTFKVVNGSWNDGAAEEKTVTLTGPEGETLKLKGEDIPAVGTKPADGYKEGAWDKVPEAGAEITEDTTYTYTYAAKDAKTKKVTFKVVNGSWNDGAAEEKTVTLTGPVGETLKLKGEDIPAVGTKPADGYKEGAWDKVPEDGAAITEDTTYTYTYAAKDTITKMVTFKVVNGSWNDGAAEEKTVTLTGPVGETLKLKGEDIPTVGTKPADGYKEGAWDKVPEAGAAITENTTYTYTYAKKDTGGDTEYIVVPEKLSDDNLSQGIVERYGNAEEVIVTIKEVAGVAPEQTGNFELFDAQIKVIENGVERPATAADIKPEGLEVIFSYPVGTNKNQVFEGVHMIGEDSGGYKAGDTEQLAFTNEDDGLHTTVHGLSPVIITWKDPTPVPTEAGITLSASEIYVTQGRESAIKAVIKPEGTSVTWSSSDKSVATVDGMGVVTGIKPGTATITAKITVEGADYTASCKVTVIPAGTPIIFPTGGGEHTHNYAWKTIEATEDADGELRYQCETCGDIKERVPLTAYNVFNKNTTEKIRSAKKDATVKIETNKWISFHKMVMEALAERPDVTLEISFLDEGHKGNRCTVVIPKGTDTMSLVDKNGFTGFLFLGGKFGMKTN